MTSFLRSGSSPSAGSPDCGQLTSPSLQETCRSPHTMQSLSCETPHRRQLHVIGDNVPVPLRGAGCGGAARDGSGRFGTGRGGSWVSVPPVRDVCRPATMPGSRNSPQGQRAGRVVFAPAAVRAEPRKNRCRSALRSSQLGASAGGVTRRREPGT